MSANRKRRETDSMQRAGADASSQVCNQEIVYQEVSRRTMKKESHPTLAGS